MAYRNDEDALLARIEALEAEKRRLERELAAATEPDRARAPAASRKRQVVRAERELVALKHNRSQAGGYILVISGLACAAPAISGHPAHSGWLLAIGSLIFVAGVLAIAGVTSAAPPRRYDYAAGRIRYLEGWLAANGVDPSRLPSPSPRASPPGREGVATREPESLADDPAFSMVLFEEFVLALYVRAAVARAPGTELAPYLSEDARKSLAARDPVEDAQVGSMRVLRTRRTSALCDGAPPSDWIRVAIEANLVRGGRSVPTREEWQLRRNRGVVTRPWKGARTFGCPRCDAHVESWATMKCSACGHTIEPGRFDWVVHGIDAKAST